MSYVYAVRNIRSGSVKIGLSSDPLSRLGQIQSGNEDEIELVGCFHGSRSDERSVHEKISRFHMRGEWFMGEAMDEVGHLFVGSHKPRRTSVDLSFRAPKDVASMLQKHGLSNSAAVRAVLRQWGRLSEAKRAEFVREGARAGGER